MNILIIGNGGREAAIAHTIKRFHPEATVYMAPGNGGAGEQFINVAIGVSDQEALVAFVKERHIDLTIVGPEVPLVEGIVDVFEAEGLRIFGPNQVCAQFEGSKDFTKNFLTKYGIPTAAYKTFTKKDREVALEAVKAFTLPVVIKADGLAAGKGVLICENYEDAQVAITDIFDDKFEGAGEKLVIEEYLTGVEASLLCFVDGESIVPMETARDYKRAYNGDLGLNTGGMGGYSPNPIITDEVRAVIEAAILQPIMQGFKEEALNFKGILFIGLMIEDNVAKVLEFNVRMGDPETQSVLPRLETDLIEILNACIDGKLSDTPIKWSDKKSVTVVTASKGYPETSHKGDVIRGIEDVSKEVCVFHAGTTLVDEQVITNGGRVLALTCVADTLEEAREIVYRELNKLSYDGMHYRTDIAETI